ncbi:GNAT family N-acetyltransferase [Amycolatopsis roodepoortensis]|uniref:GNAT family N-acetyltransferase n=1 Tax=Amycolatopsis roodepoortensis TaxID=700274 RepID=UPI00214CA43B|nr:GNAT family N-acetyltransferase [Amycolatopsis roodepoortensis]UUV35268.1 GNAT family N-acetyltransferase [Amycolatopsis roodepoortensis]
MRFAELTDETWPLFERLFGPGGVQGGCWCAFFRLTGPAFKQAGTDGRKAHVRAEVAAGKPLGLLALADDEPLGWVAVSPRPDNPRLERSPVAASAGDHAGVWSVTCFYVGRKSRRQGLSAALLRAAVDYAAERGARVVEGYPVEVLGKRPGADLYHGTVSMFAKAGFDLVECRPPARALMRFRVSADENAGRR